MSGFGRPHRHYRRTDSTNRRLTELARAGAPGGTVVTADEQTAGRGRGERSWFAPPGGALLYSALVRPLEPSHGLLPIAVPVALCEAAADLVGVECEIKWPNDIWLQGRKLAGVLIEARAGLGDGWAVVGIGLNVAIAPEELPPELRDSATSLDREVTIDAAREAVNAQLGRWTGAPAGRVLTEFAERDALRGREVAWQGAGGGCSEGSGVAEGIDETGNLVVRTPEGARLNLGAGEVHLRL